MRAEGQELLQQQQATLTQQQQAIPSHQQQVTPSQHQQLLSTAPSQHHQQDEHQQQQQQQPRPTRRSNRNNPQQRQQQDQQEQHQQQPRSRNRTNPQRRSRQQHQQHQQAGALAPWGSQASALPAAGRQVRRASRAVRRDAAGASEACTPAVPVKDWVSRAMQQRGWENSERQKREDYVPTLPEGGVPTEGFRFRLDHGYPLDVRGGGTQGRSRPGAAATHCPFFPPPFCLPLLGGLPQQGPTGCSAQTWGSQMPFEAPDAARAGLSPPLASQQVFSGQLKGSPQQQQRVQQQPHVQQQRAQQHMQHHSRLAPLPAHYLQSSSDYPFLPMTGVPTRSPLGRETHAEGSSSGTLQRRDESCRGNPSNNAQLLASEADPADFSAAAAATTEAARTGDRQTTAAQPAAATPMGDSLRCREAAGIHAAISTSDEEEGGPFSAAPAAGGTATTTAATPALSSIVALGASVACPSPYAVVREGQLQQHSWQHLSHPYWQSWQLQEHWQLQLQQQQWQQWQQQQWQQWQRLPYTVAAPVDASAYSYVPMQHLQQQQQIQQLHQLQQQQYLNLFQQQRHDWGSQRASGPSRNYQRTPRRVPQQQQQQQYQQQPIQAHYNGGVADSRRGPQRQWQQLSFPVAAADCVRHIAPGTSAAAVATAYPWSVHALAAPSVYDTTALSQSGSPMARTHGHFVAAPYMYTSTAHSAPASTFWSQPQLQQQVQQQVQQQQQQQWQWEAQSRYSRGSSNRNSREQPGRLRTVQDDRNAISGTRHIVEAHSLSCSGKVGRSSATAAAEGSRQVLSSSNADAGESTDSAAVAVKDGEEGSSRDSSRSETHSSPSRRSRSSNSSSSISNSHMLPEEGYSYTKNMAYLAPLVERKKVGPEDFVLLHVIGKGSYGSVTTADGEATVNTATSAVALGYFSGFGSGKVMLVRFEQDGQLYALKVLLKESLLRRSQVQHTRTERAVLEVITHPFIVQMHFAFQTPKKLYFVLEYCPGGELFFHLQKDRKFSEERSRFYAAELLLALEHLHKHNVIYRDLKSENVLLDADGHIRLTDFGLSKSGIADNTSARSVCGTPEYIAPEILCQVGHGKAADWWSLGALLYEMLTGLPPFYTANRQALFTNILWGGLDFPADLSPAAVDLLKSLLHRDANERLGAGPLDAEEIKRHPFFAPVDWGRLLAKEIEPPFKPRLLSHEDPKYFPAEVKREPVFSDDGEGPDAAFGSGTVRDAAARMQRSRTPNRRAAVDSSSCGGDSGKISSSSRTRPAANCAADGNCVARAASGTGGHTEDACTNERPHACSSLSSHDSQNTEEDEGDALFKGFSYDERLQGTWGKAAASTDDPYGF